MRKADKHFEAGIGDRRQRIAFEAARLMAMNGLQDYRLAKSKAAEKLGVFDPASLPSDADVHAHLRDYQRLFQGAEQAQQLRRQREAALAAMVFFERFHPRLVGRALDGTADARSPIRLHLHADDADDVTRLLLDSDIPAEPVSRPMRLDRKPARDFPAWLFSADSLPFEVIVLPETSLRQAPLGGLDGKPMQRASITALRKLLVQNDDRGGKENS